MELTQQFNIISGHDSIRTYDDRSTDGGASAKRSFCANCGSPLFFLTETWPHAMIVTTGTLDERGGGSWKPKLEYYCKRRLSWLPVLEETEKHVG